MLAFDTSGAACSAAVLRDGAVAARRFAAMARGQAEALMPMIDAVLAEAGTTVEALDLVAVTTGPGAFTGLRIGLAAARGLALAADLPLLGITSFAAVAAEATPAGAGRTLVVALDSKRREFYLQAFAGETPQGEGALVAPEDVAAFLPPGPLLLAGDAAPALARLPALAGRGLALAEGPGLPDPAVVARLAARRWQPGMRPPLPRPLYLRPPDTTTPRRRAGAP